MPDVKQTSNPVSPLRWQHQAVIAACFCLAVFITRMPAFFRSIMDPDESLYFLMAAQWRVGHLPYTTIWDNKPPGIYAIFALFQIIFGGHLWSIRIAAACFISATAFAVFQIARHVPAPANHSSTRPAIFAGIAYIICSLSNDGLAANTEIFMDCFTAFAMLCALSPSWLKTRPIWRGFICGVCFGMAVMTKYVAIFEAPAAAFALLFLFPQNAKLRLMAGAVFGGALPLSLTILLYAAAGDLPFWWTASIASNFRRVSTSILPHTLINALDMQGERWLPLYAAAVMLAYLTAWQSRHRPVDESFRFQIFLLLWLGGGLIGVTSAKSFYDHYFLQVLPVLCVILAWAVTGAAGRRNLQSAFMALLIALPAIAASRALIKAAQPNFALENGQIFHRPDTEAQIAAEISSVAPPNQVYVFDSEPIIYSLARQTPPTRYAFPSILTKCFLSHVAAVRATVEVRRILAAKPEFIVISRYPVTDPVVVNRAVYVMLRQVLATRYQLWRSYNTAILYRLTPGNTAPIIAPSIPESCKTGE